ncbi:MAG: sporulation transcriptional regulator SpoIIID [Lachnospiraceae bacterium]|nr:sporulation transcriptional regulator SpoIIID [Lachnospiraceae bacterium]
MKTITRGQPKHCTAGYLSSAKHQQIEERAITVAEYIVEKNATVRQAAKAFGISKSTVHKDITDRLGAVNPALAEQAREVLNRNKSERHIRGGMATKKMYDSKRRKTGDEAETEFFAHRK